MPDTTRASREQKQQTRLHEETAAVWATVVCFAAGAVAGLALFGGEPRTLSGPGSLAIPTAAVAGIIAAASFVVSTVRSRRGETTPMPRWQTVVSNLSTMALTVAFGAVTAMGVLLAAEVLSAGLEGLRLAAPGGALLGSVAAATGGRLAFGAGVRLRTSDLAGLLFGFLVIGTLFAMLTAADPRWWEINFSQLGLGAGGWAFNGTLVIAGLLVATVGSYIGRDLHRLSGDAALGWIAWVVALWGGTGAALAMVGLVPLHPLTIAHNIAAFGAVGLFLAAGVLTTLALPGPPRGLVITTVGVAALVVIAVLLAVPFRLYSITVLEVVVVGLGLLWMATLVRFLAVFAPQQSRPSARASLLHS